MMSPLGYMLIMAFVVVKIPVSGEKFPVIYDSSSLLNSNLDPSNMTSLCTVAIVVDPSFFVAIANSSALRTLQLVKHWMPQVDHVFRSADFDNDTNADKIGLQITKVALYPEVDDTTSRSARRTSLQMMNDLSREDYLFKGVCAGLHFVYHPMDQPQNQIRAPVSSPDRGICSSSLKQAAHADINSQSQLEATIFNALPVNFYNSNGPRAIAHQLGHLFGSKDDEDYAMQGIPCASNVTDRDRFVMSESRLGHKEQEMVWSECSKIAIKEFLRFKKKYKTGCLKDCSGDECEVIARGNRTDDNTPSVAESEAQPLDQPVLDGPMNITYGHNATDPDGKDGRKVPKANKMKNATINDDEGPLQSATNQTENTTDIRTTKLPNRTTSKKVSTETPKTPGTSPAKDTKATTTSSKPTIAPKRPKIPEGSHAMSTLAPKLLNSTKDTDNESGTTESSATTTRKDIWMPEKAPEMPNGTTDADIITGTNASEHCPDTIPEWHHKDDGTESEEQYEDAGFDGSKTYQTLHNGNATYFTPRTTEANTEKSPAADEDQAIDQNNGNADDPTNKASKTTNSSANHIVFANINPYRVIIPLLVFFKSFIRNN